MAQASSNNMDTNQPSPKASPLTSEGKQLPQRRRLSQPFKSPVVRSSPAAPTSLSAKISTPKRLHGAFKSPMKPQNETTSPLVKRAKREANTEELLKREADLDKEIAELESSGLKTEEIDKHIELLHNYNEMKDAAQTVLGRLAELENVTVREMHEKYSLPLNE